MGTPTFLYQWDTNAWYEFLKLTQGISVADLSPFDGELDNDGSSNLKYKTLYDAYEAQKKFLFSSANIVESNNIQMQNADQIYLYVGQNTKWSLDKYVVNSGDGGESFTLNFSDSSSIFEYAIASAGEKPFNNFDVNSTLVISGNNGVISNKSIVPTANIECAGSLIIKDVTFLLPNVVGGGIKSSSTTVVDNVKFIGGGTTCEKAFFCEGGRFSNILLTGAFKTNATINDALSRTDFSNIIFDLTDVCTFNLLGQAVNLLQNNVNNPVNVNLSSNSYLSNSTINSAIFLSGVTYCSVENTVFYEGISFANDNSNTNLKFSNCTFTQEVIVYGTNIRFESCDFQGGLTIMTGSTGVLEGCTSAIAITNNGTYQRSNNDSNIGNDSAGETWNYITKTFADSGFSVQDHDYVSVDATGGNVQFNLPDDPAVGFTMKAFKIDATSNSIVPHSNVKPIIGDPTLDVQGDPLEIIYNGTAYLAI